MKFLISLYYTLRSVLLRGPIASWQMWRREAEGDQRLHIQSGGIVKSQSRSFFHYQGASYRVLERIFSKLKELTAIRSFMDIGCGMGRVLFVAEKEGFSKLAGVELSKNLIDIAEKNLESYQKRSPESTFKFINQNALVYHYDNEACVYFLFNPFDASILKPVIEKILEENNQACWFVYMNPLYCRVFDSFGIKPCEELRTGFYLEALFYHVPAR